MRASEGFEARPLRPEDAAAAADVLRDYDSRFLPDRGELLSEQDVADWWLRHELERESVGVWRGEALAAFGVLEPREEGAVELDGFVRPTEQGHGLGSFLLAWGERAAEARGAARLRAAVTSTDQAGAALVRGRGYVPVRSFYRMVVDLGQPLARAVWPEGFEVSSLRPGEEPLLHEVTEDAFAEEWGRPRRSFAEWERNVFGAEFFDRSLAFLVRHEGEVVAGELAAQRFGMGWIGSIGVRERWRRLGLGRALLLHAFGALYERGERRVGLGVDAANATNATKVYESVGMGVAWQADLYEKTL